MIGLRQLRPRRSNENGPYDIRLPLLTLDLKRKVQVTYCLEALAVVTA